MIGRLLIANRGEIAVRIIRTCRRLGIETVLLASTADAAALPARLADRTVVIGPPQAAKSYLDHRLVVHAAVATGCHAIHPGYGFLSERAELAALAEEAGLIFVGPRPETIEQLGDKLRSRRLAKEAGAPQVSGSEGLASAAEAAEKAAAIGYPVLLKAASGGGGRGMAVVRDEVEVSEAFPRLTREAHDAFGDGTLYMEAFVETARHVEIQVVGDGRGGVWSLGERDCSVQRRYQKVIEEAPATILDHHTREAMVSSATKLLASLNYRGVGTVEFLYDPAREQASFMEVNTRLQVEHPVTEMVTGLDLVELQLQVAEAEDVSLPSLDPVGHAVEFRINAERPDDGFRPSPGTIDEWVPPVGEGVRLDTFMEAGATVTPYYDSMLGKLIVHGSDRPDALRRAAAALAAFRVTGIDTNIELLRQICIDPDFINDRIHTRWLETAFLTRTAA